MLQDFFEYLNAKFQISEDEFESIRELIVYKKIKKRNFLLQEGDVWRYHAFVVKGLLRTYTIDNKGTEHIIQFSLENNWIGDMDSYASGRPSNYNIDALEDCEVVLLSKVNFEKLIAFIPQFANYMKQVFEVNFIESQNRILFNISLSSEQKYLNFIKKYAEASSRFPQNMIASYLGISAETLSRIKSNSSKR